ncbi:MAG: GumC family protein [Pararhizobium sp.]
MKDIRFYYAILLRRLPYFLAIVVVVSVIGCVVTYMLPPVYRATAQILVEAPKISADLAPSTVPNNPIEQLTIYQQEITTREHLLALASKLDVYGKRRSEYSDADVVDDMRARTTFDLVSDGRNGSATAFSVSFDDHDPKIAARVVNEFVALILNKNDNARTGRATDTLQFFSNEVTRLGDQLKSMDSQILSFTNDHRDALPDSLDFRRLQQSSLQERLQMLEWEEAGLRNRRNNLVQMAEATGSITKGAPMTLDQQTLQDLKRTLSDQLVLFSPDSPNIAALRSRITALEASIRTAARNAADTTAPADMKKPPSELDFQLSDIDERLGFIARERSSINKNLEKLAKSIAATPDNAMVLNALQRTRSNVQDQYSAAVKRYSEASMGKQIEVNAKGEHFTLVEPAVPPHDPVWPRRKRLIAMSVAAGLGLGLGFIVLLEMLNKSIRRPLELVEALQIQPIATIPFIDLDRGGRLPYLKYAAGLVIVAVLGQLLWISSLGNP